MSEARPAGPRLRRFLTRRFGRRLRDPFPPVDGNRLEPFEHGDDFYVRMLEAVDGAARSVDVEMYLWEDDEVGHRFVAALVRAAERGLRVRVLADAQGARGMLDELPRISAAGGDVRIFNPFRWRWFRRSLQRTHKKILLLDGAAAFVGGAGFSRHFSPHFSRGKRRERAWHDRMFEVRGPVTAQLGKLFEVDFGRWERRQPRAPAHPGDECRLPEGAGAGGARLRVLRGWPDARDFRPLLLESVAAARERVWIGTPYFLPPRTVRRALYVAAARGVDVRVVLPSAEHAHPLLYHAARARYGRWLRRGVKLHEFGDSFYHAKAFVADRAVAIVGSSNLDSWSWRRNAEVDLAATDAATVEEIAELLASDRARSREVTREDARVRSFLGSVRQGVAAWFEDWL